jgi:hypothetical protein
MPKVGSYRMSEFPLPMIELACDKRSRRGRRAAHSADAGEVARRPPVVDAAPAVGKDGRR